MKRSLFTLTFLFALVATMAAATGQAQPAGPAWEAVALALGALAVMPAIGKALGGFRATGLLFTSVVISALNTAYGAEFRDNSKSAADLTEKLFESAAFDSLFTIDYTDLTVWEKGTSESGPITQAFQEGFTESGTFTFKPSKFPLFDIKMDMRLSSHKVKRSFIGWAHRNNRPQTDQEFVNYIINVLAAPQHVEDVELYGCWSGVHVAPTTGVAGAPGAMMDGFRKYINDAITANTITPIATGSAPSDPEDYVDWVEGFAKQLPNPEKNTPMTVAMNLTAFERFQEGMRIKYHTYYKADDADKTRVCVNPRLTVQGFAAMGSSSKIFCAPKFNLVKAVNQGEGPLFNFEQQDRSLKVFGDYMLAYGVWNHDRFYTNDVDLVDPGS